MWKNLSLLDSKHAHRVDQKNWSVMLRSQASLDEIYYKYDFPRLHEFEQSCRYFYISPVLS